MLCTCFSVSTHASRGFSPQTYLTTLFSMHGMYLQEGTAPPTVANKTELSQKVEAELFQEYDAMVPGPASSSTVSVEGVDGRGGGGEKLRTGRPLAINLDLLSYRARQKAIKVCEGVVEIRRE